MAVILIVEDDIFIREIAEMLGKSEGAIKQLQFRALERLRTRMSGKEGGVHA